MNGDGGDESLNEQWVQDTSMKLQLLRGWKRFNTNRNDIELLLMSMEEVLGMVRTWISIPFRCIDMKWTKRTRKR